MKNDMASPIPTKGSTVESHDPKERTITDVVSVKPASPLADQFRQQTGTEEEAVEETADGERNPDFDQESILRTAWSERRVLEKARTSSRVSGLGCTKDVHQ